MGQIKFLPPFAISYDEARRNQAMQDKISAERIKIRNWAIDKTQYEIAAAYMAWRRSFRSHIRICTIGDTFESENPQEADDS